MSVTNQKTRCMPRQNDKKKVSPQDQSQGEHISEKTKREGLQFTQSGRRKRWGRRPTIEFY